VIPFKSGVVRKPTEIGIGGIVSVKDDRTNLEMYERLESPYLWLPIKGRTIPSIKQLKFLYQFVIAIEREG
jgi:atypical dual specificity phosphatase